MKAIRIFVLLALTGILSAAEKLPVLSYNFDLKPLSGGNGAFADPGFRKLTDGKLNGEGNKVIIRYIENRGKPTVFSFHFKTEVKLSEAKIHYYREKNSYGIKAIRLIGIQKDDKQIPLGGITLNHPYKRPEEEPALMCAEIKSDDDTPVKRIDVVFTGTGGYLGLTEIEFFGEALKGSNTTQLSSNNLQDGKPASAAAR